MLEAPVLCRDLTVVAIKTSEQRPLFAHWRGNKDMCIKLPEATLAHLCAYAQLLGYLG